MLQKEPLIIECRCNEAAPRRDNSSLPYSPREIVREAVRAWKAGASIFHFHARDPETGEPQDEVGLYREAIVGIREQTDLLIHPTLGGPEVQTSPEERVRHILALNNDSILRVEMAPVDMGSIDMDVWDARARRFMTQDYVYLNNRARIESTLKLLKEYDVFASAICWNVGHIRTALKFREMGLLSDSTLWELFFTGVHLPTAASSSMSHLRSMTAEVPENEPWLVVCYMGDVMHLAAWAITLGGHVGIGLGDYSYSRFGSPNNGELVGLVADMSRTLGRPVATPSETRAMLKIRPRTDLPARNGAVLSQGGTE